MAVPASPSPGEAFLLREAVGEDFPGYITFFDYLGLHLKPNTYDKWLRDMAPTTFFLCRGDNRKVAYTFVEIFSATGYIRHFSVAPEVRGQGVGRRLMQALADELRSRGCLEWRLNVFKSNAPAIALYKSSGLRIMFACAFLTVPWTASEQLPGASHVEQTGLPSEIEPQEDPWVEARFQLPPGQLAHLRAIRGNLLVKVIGQQPHASTGSGVQKIGGVGKRDVAAGNLYLGLPEESPVASTEQGRETVPSHPQESGLLAVDGELAGSGGACADERRGGLLTRLGNVAAGDSRGAASVAFREQEGASMGTWGCEDGVLPAGVRTTPPSGWNAAVSTLGPGEVPAEQRPAHSGASDTDSGHPAVPRPSAGDADLNCGNGRSSSLGPGGCCDFVGEGKARSSIAGLGRDRQQRLLLGCACFHQTGSGGCNPFKADSIGVAKQLLSWLQGEVQGKQNSFKLTLEGRCLDLVKDFQDVGAVVTVDAYHMEGTLVKEVPS